MVGNSNLKRNTRRNSLIFFGIILFNLGLINYLGSVKFYRLDLTEEGRFSLSDSTKVMLKNLDDIVYVRCYLEGEFNPGFKRLRNSTKEMLNEFKAYGGNNFDYEFIDPFADPDPKEQEKMKAQLSTDGLIPTVVYDKEGDQSSERTIYPGAIFSYKSHEITVQLLKNQVSPDQDPNDLLNNSVEALEYEFSKAIFILKRGEYRKQIRFSKGHGELKGLETVDAYQSLNELYAVKKVEITNSINSIPPETNLLIIAKPDTFFNDAAKYNIDQFIMRGGRVLWLVDNTYASTDSLYSKRGFDVSFPLSLNLDDQLFNYGVRINSNLVLDANCAKIPVSRKRLATWPYSPVVIPNSDHIIVKNLNAIRFNYVSSVDTVKSPGIKKTVLLRSSELSKIKFAPDRISLQSADLPEDEKIFDKKNVPLAVLLEGKFESVFKNRLIQLKELDRSSQPLMQSVETKMIVVGDGDVIKNSFSYKDGSPFPMGFDPMSGAYYSGNKTFILNCVNYLLDDGWLIPLRSKQFKLRMLDKKKTIADGDQWRLICTLGPVLMVVLFGIFYTMYRKNKYAK